ARRNLLILEHQGAGADQRARPDARAGEDDRSHTDQTLVLDHAAVEDRAVADGDARPDPGRTALVDVNYRVVLEIGLGADHDRCRVAAHHGVEPHAGTRADLHVADDHRARGDEHAGVQAEALDPVTRRAAR